MENRVYPDNILIRLYEERDHEKKHGEQYTLETCIGMGANCVTYQALREDGIPVRLKQFRPAGLDRKSSVFRLAEERFVQSYQQQISMMRDEGVSAITSGLYGLYRDESGYCWTSVSSMVGRTLDRILPETSLPGKLNVIRRVAESVKAYHRSGWLLLDIKPENILVIDSLGLHGVNYFDFDSFIQESELRKAAEEGRQIILSSSESYSAPELCEAEPDLNEIGITVDFYSVGALLFNAVFDRRPELFDCLPACEYDFSSSPESEQISSGLRAALTAFLNHTLTMSSFDRYETDDQLLDALDQILNFCNTAAPRLSRSVPGPVRDFLGRGVEIEKLSSALRNASSPIFLSGMGGIGKTQLALSVAKELSGEFDFYYVPFKGSVRETVLALPMENLRTEEPDGSGASVRLPDEVIYQNILSCLRNGYDKRSVLIVDNFDSIRDEDTPSLLYDPDLSDLLTLPMQLLFTSRSRFDIGTSVEVGSLDDQALIQMLSDAMPDEDEDTLLRVADRVGRHTLTLRILTATALENKGNVSAEQLMESFGSGNSDGNVATALHSVFRAAQLSKTGRSVMACAGLFPQRGVSSDLLIQLFSSEQWVAANHLERCGWLHYDGYSGVWTVHPLIRSVCKEEKSTQPDWTNVGSFVNSLRKLLDSPSFSEISPEGKAQLNEMFSNAFRLKLKKPFPWKPVSAVGFVLLAALAFFLFRSPKDLSPVLTLRLVPDETATAEELSHDTELLLGRARSAGIKDVKVNEQTGEVVLTTHTSVFGDFSNLDETISLLFNRPGALAALSSKTLMIYYYEEIDREHIISAEYSYGVPPGLSPEMRKEVGLDVSGDFPYLTLRFDDEANKILQDSLEEYGNLSFSFDETMANELGITALKLRGVVPGEEENSYYVFDGRWTGESIYQTLENNLLHEPLANCYSKYWELNPRADWENPGSLPEELQGQNQQQIDDIPEESVVFYYNTSDPDSISDYTYQQALLSLKRRLDLLNIPYAIGTDYFQPRRIAVCIPTEKAGYDIINMLCTTNLTLKPLLTDGYFPTNSCTASIIDLPDGNYALQLKTEDSYNIDSIKEVSSRMQEKNDHILRLFCGSNITIASAEIDHMIEDGTLVFSSLPFIGCERIGEDELWILTLLQQIINNRYLSDYSVYYRFENEYYFCSEDGSFGMERCVPWCDRVIDQINSEFPSFKAWRNASASDETVYVSMHVDLQPGIAASVADTIEELYQRCSFEESGVDTFLLFLADEGPSERFRFSFNKLEAHILEIDQNYVGNLITMGETMQPYADEFDKEFQSRPFFTDRSFYTTRLS